MSIYVVVSATVADHEGMASRVDKAADGRCYHLHPGVWAFGMPSDQTMAEVDTAIRSPDYDNGENQHLLVQTDSYGGRYLNGLWKKLSIWEKL